MRDFLIILSLLISLAFGAFNYVQFAGLFRDISLIEYLNNLKGQLNEDRALAFGFYLELAQQKDYPGELFERFNEGPFFSREYKESVDRLEAVLNEKAAGLPVMLEKLTALRRAYNRLNYDPNRREASLDAIQQWIRTLDHTYGELLSEKQKVVAYLANDTRQRLEMLVPYDICMILLIFSLWYWLGHQKHRSHLDATLALNQDLEKKKASLLASQKVMASIYDDMRHEKNTAQRLASENQQLALIVEQANDAIFRLTPQGRIEHVNDAVLDLFGCSAAQMTGKGLWSLFRSDQQGAIERAVNQVNIRQSHQVIHLSPSLPADATRQDAIERVYEAAFSCLLDDKANMIGIVAVVRDISYQYQEVAQLRKIIYQAPIALVMVNKKGVIVLSNQKADHLFDYPESELLGEEIEMLVPDGRVGEHKLWRDTFMEAPVPRRMGRGDEVRLKRKDGTLVPAEIGLSPISAQGHDYTIASIVDMSQAVNQKNALSRLNRQLAEKNREMEQFIYTVSHDLRSPLVTIEAFARKLATELAGQLSDKQAHRLTRIQANVSHMDQLLTDLLSLSRVIKRELQITTLDTSKLVAKLLNTLEAEISEVNADIAVEQPLLPLTANESLFYQCLQNLVVNAIKYRHPDRRLEIHIGTIKKDNMTGISVADNGVGIDEKYHEQIFGIFERLEQGSGTGVGLAIVNAIVEKHNGTIKLESAPGKGSCFTLFFPDLSDNEQY